MSKAYILNNKVYLLGKEKNIGTISDGDFYAVRSQDKHYFRNSDGWAINTEVLNLLDERGIDNVIFIVKTKGGAYRTRTKLSRFFEHGELINFGERQLVLPGIYWTQQKVKQEELFKEEV